MGAAMNPPNMSEANAGDRRKGRWQLLLILLRVIGPMVLATFMYKLQFWGAGQPQLSRRDDRQWPDPRRYRRAGG